MTLYKLPIGEIVVKISNGSGSIASNLKEKCPSCGSEAYCYQETKLCPTNELLQGNSRILFNMCIDAIESLILAHACAGINISSKKYVEGLQTALDAIGNNMGD